MQLDFECLILCKWGKKVETRYQSGFQNMVGKTGFEPATPWSQTRCATGLRYFPNGRLDDEAQK
jgi:hypothetical protein